MPTDKLLGFIPEAATPKGQARIKQMLSVATTIVKETGLSELSLRSVSKSCDVRLSNVQHYFESQESLLRAIIGKILIDQQEEASAYILEQGASTPLETFRSTCQYFLRVNMQLPTQRFWIDLAALAKRNELVNGIFIDAYGPYLERFTGLIKTIEPALSEEQARERATLVITMIDGTILIPSANGAVPAPEQLAQREALFIANLQKIAFSSDPAGTAN